MGSKATHPDELDRLLGEATARLEKLESAGALERREDAYRRALQELVGTLAATRGQFRSKRLGALRERIERLLTGEVEVQAGDEP